MLDIEYSVITSDVIKSLTVLVFAASKYSKTSITKALLAQSTLFSLTKFWIQTGIFMNFFSYVSPKHMFWVLKGKVAVRGFFKASKTMLIGKKS